jgi:hypothetical protein
MWPNLLRIMKWCIGLAKFPQTFPDNWHIFWHCTNTASTSANSFNPGNSTFLQSNPTKWCKKPNYNQHCHINHYENLKGNDLSKLYPGSQPASVRWETYSKKKLACSIYDSTNAWRDNVF